MFFSGVNISFTLAEENNPGVDLEYVIEMNEMDPYGPDPKEAEIELKISNNNEETLYFVFGIKHNSECCLNFTTEMVKEWKAISRIEAYSSNQKLNIYFDESEETLSILENYGWTFAGHEFCNPEKSAFVLPNAPEEVTINYHVKFDKQHYSMFMFPVNADIKSIKIKFNLPENWVITPFLKEGDYYIVKDYPKSILETLTNAPLSFYPAEFHSKKVKNVEVILATRKKLNTADQNKRLNMYSRLFEYFVDLYGPYKYEKFIIMDDCTRIMIRELYSGFSIEREFSEDPELFILLTGNGWFRYSYFHEWLHTWNYDILGPDFHSWFHDGMGEYFVARGPKDVFGLDNVYKAYLYFNWEWYKKRWGTELETPLAKNPGGGSIQPEHWMLYAQGTLFFYMLDEKIKELTNNEKDFSDVLQHMYKHYYNRTITMAMFEGSVEVVTGTPMDMFFSEYLYGDKHYPLEYLENYKKEYYEYMDKNIKLFYYGVPILYFITIELRQKCKDKFDMMELFETCKNRPSYIDFMRNNYDIENLSEAMIIDSLNGYSGNDCSDFFELYMYKDGKLSVKKLKELLLSGRKLKYEANLDPFKAALSITSEPPGAMVTIEGTNNTVGTTPLDVKLDYGSYTIRTEKEGYETSEEEISLRSCETKEMSFQMVPKSASLVITSDPENATVFFEGENKGTTPLALELEDGTYEITIGKEDYETYTQTITLPPGGSKEISAELILKKAILSINSIPSASAYVNDSCRGTTPLNLELEGGTYEITIEKEGYETHTETIELSLGESKEISTTLEKDNSSYLMYIAGAIGIFALLIGFVYKTRKKTEKETTEKK